MRLFRRPSGRYRPFNASATRPGPTAGRPGRRVAADRPGRRARPYGSPLARVPQHATAWPHPHHRGAVPTDGPPAVGSPARHGVEGVAGQDGRGFEALAVPAGASPNGHSAIPPPCVAGSAAVESGHRGRACGESPATATGRGGARCTALRCVRGVPPRPVGEPCGRRRSRTTASGKWRQRPGVPPATPVVPVPTPVAEGGATGLALVLLLPRLRFSSHVASALSAMLSPM